MSESAEQRTKRRYIGHLLACHWQYQYSIFYNRLDDSHKADLHAHKLKRNISRAFKMPLLHRLQLKGGLSPEIFEDTDPGKRVTAAYHSFLSAESMDSERIWKIAAKVVGHNVKVKSKRLTPGKLNSIENSIKRQRPHDLASFFGKSHVQRISLLNKRRIGTGAGSWPLS